MVSWGEENVQKEGAGMTKKQMAALTAAAGAGAWCVCRNKKYPVRKELRFANKLTVPGWTLNLNTAKLANRALDRMALTPPAYVEVEEFDCLHDEGIAYAKALETAGVTVQLEDVTGTFHGFDFFEGKGISRTMAEKRTQALRNAFYQ